MTDPNTQPVDEPVNQPRNFTLEGNDTSGYVGVDAEYRNYANEIDRPYLTDEEREHLKTVGQLTDDEKLAAQQEQPADEQVVAEEPEEPVAPETPGQTKTNGEGNLTPLL